MVLPFSISDCRRGTGSGRRVAATATAADVPELVADEVNLNEA
jgi:hypothetical protein